MPPSFRLAMLQPRLDDSSSSSKLSTVCAKPLTNDVGISLFGGSSITFHQLMIYVSAACTILTILGCFFLSWKHVHRYTAPQEQRQIVRIVNLPIFYAIFNLLALVWYQDYLYIQPISGIYEAFTVSAMFLLTLEYVCPDGTDREKFFDNLPAQSKHRKRPLPGGSLKWFQVS